MTTTIEVKNVQKAFGAFTALEDVSFTIQRLSERSLRSSRNVKGGSPMSRWEMNFSWL